jgi:anti-anti-sigma factor
VGNAEASIEVAEAGPAVVVRLLGAHDIDTADRLRVAFSAAVEARRPLVINLSRAILIDSIVLGLIITAHSRSERRGGGVILVVAADTAPTVRNLLRVSLIASHIDTYPSEDAALRRLGIDPGDRR